MAVCARRLFKCIRSGQWRQDGRFCSRLIALCGGISLRRAIPCSRRKLQRTILLRKAGIPRRRHRHRHPRRHPRMSVSVSVSASWEFQLKRRAHIIRAVALHLIQLNIQSYLPGCANVYPFQYTRPLTQTSHHSKRHLDCFARVFAGITVVSNGQTDRQTDEVTLSVPIGHFDS